MSEIQTRSFETCVEAHGINTFCVSKVGGQRGVRQHHGIVHHPPSITHRDARCDVMSLSRLSLVFAPKIIGRAV